MLDKRECVCYDNNQGPDCDYNIAENRNLYFILTLMIIASLCSFAFVYVDSHLKGKSIKLLFVIINISIRKLILFSYLLCLQSLFHLIGWLRNRMYVKWKTIQAKKKVQEPKRTMVVNRDRTMVSWRVQGSWFMNIPSQHVNVFVYLVVSL